jgi:outer membrane protein assembly factor BamB
VSSERQRWSRRRIVIGLGALVAVLAGAAAVFALTREGDVSNPNVEFRAEPTQTPVAADEKPAGKGRKKAKKRRPLDGFRWAHYGYTKDRRRYLAADFRVRPPFKRRWNWDGRVLLELPPIIVGNRLFLTKNDGMVVALNRTTGKVVWKRDMGYLAASSPAFGDGRIYVTILERERGVRAGRVAALRARDGKLAWSRPLASRTESSPLHDGDFVYFGAEDGSVYAMRDGSGNVAWKFRASGAVKGGLALDGGKLYFGAYGGTAYAVWKDSGRQAWSNGAPGGNLYATPAVAFGRVYIGSTNGRMYSFSSATGSLAWSRGTGSYVYASPAVAHVPGGQPTVYFGSYDGTFYALDARSGNTRWTHSDGGKISGAATVVGNIVYYSNWGKRNSTALGARTGRKVWSTSRGAFNPVISNGETIYLTGFSSVAAFEPKGLAKAKRAGGAKKGNKAKKGKKADKRRKGGKRRKAERRRKAEKRRKAERRRRNRRSRRAGN